MDRSSRLVGKEWEVWGNKLLACRYRPGDYQPVPDKHGGDAGIEGYSTNGCVYQMKGPEAEPGSRKWHNSLRDKITQDVGKFIANKDNKLSDLLGSLKIRRWILLVPSFTDREIVAHARKKTEEVLAANPPYIDQHDFQVVVLDEDAFAAEKAQLLRYAVEGIDISTEPVSEEVIDGWSEDERNAYKVEHLTAKTAKMPTLVTEQRRVAFERQVIKWWLEGQNVLEELRDYADAWEAIRLAKSEQEKYLQGHCMVTNQEPYPLLKEALAEIERTVEQRVIALSPGSRRAVAHEAVADWLMRCPLDFPEVASDEQA